MRTSRCSSLMKHFVSLREDWHSFFILGVLLLLAHSNKIYRQAAIRARQSRFSNPVSIVGSMSASVSAALILCVMAALLAYAMTATYTRKYVVSGVLQAESGSIAVYSPFDGSFQLMLLTGNSFQRAAPRFDPC
ncbi:hypothetical protein V2V90_00115 [Agrobacterium leguminum]|uniref:hypothetical protein n=1 Tax=Agrobacterium leguminum TaxID=2792015 RepID=UPI0030D2E30D